VFGEAVTPVRLPAPIEIAFQPIVLACCQFHQLTPDAPYVRESWRKRMIWPIGGFWYT